MTKTLRIALSLTLLLEAITVTDEKIYVGVTGPTGYTGQIGVRGPSKFGGPIGATGPRGATGYTGPTGATGTTGGTGRLGRAEGQSGATGVLGPVGSTGVTGPAGRPGKPVELCPSGAPTTVTFVWDAVLTLWLSVATVYVIMLHHQAMKDTR